MFLVGARTRRLLRAAESAPPHSEEVRLRALILFFDARRLLVVGGEENWGSDELNRSS